jgi:hypothetical protein
MDQFDRTRVISDQQMRRINQPHNSASRARKHDGRSMQDIALGGNGITVAITGLDFEVRGYGYRNGAPSRRC